MAGRLYGVCSAGECIVTDAETGLVLVTLDGSKQEAFIAPGSLVYVSDDAAVVTELFKLAPCRGVVAKLLLRKAGGWLPRGFTELEYLESSGTQGIAVPHILQRDSGWSMKHQIPSFNSGSYVYYYLNAQGNYKMYIGRDGFFNRLQFRLVTPYFQRDAFIAAENIDYEICTHEYNYKNGGIISMSAGGKYHSNVIDTSNFAGRLQIVALMGNFTNGSFSASSVIRLFSAKITQGIDVVHDFVPVLDDTGTPCMYDKVSKQCFYNKGTGTFGYRIKGAPATFALRDPHRVAPSGVYARLIAENELELIADTEEVTGDGWEWFANTAEAYEHFGITQDELLTE